MVGDWVCLLVWSWVWALVCDWSLLLFDEEVVSPTAPPSLVETTVMFGQGRTAARAGAAAARQADDIDGAAGAALAAFAAIAAIAIARAAIGGDGWAETEMVGLAVALPPAGGPPPRRRWLWSCCCWSGRCPCWWRGVAGLVVELLAELSTRDSDRRGRTCPCRCPEPERELFWVCAWVWVGV